MDFNKFQFPSPMTSDLQYKIPWTPPPHLNTLKMCQSCNIVLLMPRARVLELGSILTSGETAPVNSGTSIYSKLCLWSWDPCIRGSCSDVCAQGEDGRPLSMGDCSQPLLSPHLLSRSSPHLPHPPPIAGWKLREGNKAKKWQGHQDGTECCTSKLPLNCHHRGMKTHARKTAFQAPPAHTQQPPRAHF